MEQSLALIFTSDEVTTKYDISIRGRNFCRKQNLADFAFLRNWIPFAFYKNGEPQPFIPEKFFKMKNSQMMIFKSSSNQFSIIFNFSRPSTVKSIKTACIFWKLQKRVLEQIFLSAITNINFPQILFIGPNRQDPLLWNIRKQHYENWFPQKCLPA